jgi:hypothetical protein
VVDEEIAIRELLERALRSLGLEVATAKNGIEAIALFGHPVSVALLDLGMQGLDGPSSRVGQRRGTGRRGGNDLRRGRAAWGDFLGCVRSLQHIEVES